LQKVEQTASVRFTTADKLHDALRGADVLLAWDFQSNALKDAWPAADSLKWVHVAAAGVDKFLFPELIASDTVVTNSRGVFDDAMAEWVLGTVLAFAKDLPHTLDLQRRHEWKHRESERIAGRTALVVGAGSIGRACARLLTAAGLRVRGVGRTARPGDADFADIVATTDLDDVLGEADYVVVTAPLTEQTNRLFDAGRLRLMKPTARLINVGRGPIVVGDDLVEALRAGVIAGAALDVFEEEPLPAGSPMWDTPGLLVSPHMSGDYIGWLDTLADLFTENFERWMAGKQLRNLVDKGLGYVPAAPAGDRT
jgi:phosphoglycerate dehydrogenase-like enzyme